MVQPASVRLVTEDRLQILSGGDVDGPVSAVDNTLARFDTTTGKKIQGSGIVVDDNNDITLPDGADIAVNTATGTKIGTATTQKLGFFNATPVVQQTATTDLGTVLSNLGLRAAGTAYPLSTTGNSTLSGPMRNNPAANLTTAATLTVGTSVYVQRADATTAAFTVTLAATTTAGYRFLIMKVDSTANAVTVAAANINGITNNIVLTRQYQFVELMSTTVSGTWQMINVGPVEDRTNLMAARVPDTIMVGALTRDANDAVTSAGVVWPDGIPGTYTATTLSTEFPGAVDAYTITYGSPTKRTYTQPAVTRNETGAVTNLPAITVT